MKAMLIAVLTLTIIARAQAQQNAQVDQGILAYQNLDYEGAVDFMRRALRSTGALTLEDQQRALSYLGASEFFLGHRDASVSAFRDLSKLDARSRLDPLLFPPDVQRVYE